jgi:hypothetical protein
VAGWHKLFELAACYSEITAAELCTPYAERVAARRGLSILRFPRLRPKIAKRSLLRHSGAEETAGSVLVLK